MKKIFLFLFFMIYISCEQKNTEKNTLKIENTDTTQVISDQKEYDSIDYERIGFELMTSESLNKLQLGIKVDEVLKIIGEPTDKSKNEFWEADGEYHQTYNYSTLGIELDIIGENQIDKKVNMITITKPCDFATKKGISIGSNYNIVKKAYIKHFNPDFSDSETIVAGSIYGGVIFNFEAEKVSSIFIGAGAE